MRVLPILICCVAVGQTQRVLPVSLKRAVEIALTPEGSPKVAIAEETIQQAEMRRIESRGDLLPDLESSVNDQRETENLHAFGFNFKIPIAGFAFPTIVGPFSVFDARATASQTVLDFAAIDRYKASKVNVAAAKADFDATRNQVSDQIARAYLACLRADATLELAHSNVELSEALVKQAQQVKEAGTGTGIDVTRNQSQLANDRQHLVVATNDRRRAGLNLLRAMGLNLATDVQLTDKLDYRPADIGTLEAALAEAKSLRAELRAQKEREASARLTYNAAKFARLPSIGASANYGTIGSALIGAQPTYDYGFSVRVPVFNGGKTDAQKYERMSEYRQEQTRTRDVEDQVELDVRLAFESVSSAVAEIDAANEGMTLAENELAQARRRYQAGVADAIEVTDAQTRLDRAHDNRIAALYDYNLARIDLATATGRIGEYVNQ